MFGDLSIEVQVEPLERYAMPAGVKSIECPPCFMIDIVQRFGGALRWDGRL